MPQALKTFQNNKSPGNDGILAEFYKTFWPELEVLWLILYQKEEMSPLQRQAVISLLNKGKDRTPKKKWRPISLLNVDYKIASKTVAHWITNYLPKLINNNQAGYVQNRNILENIRTVIDIMEYLKMENRPGTIININFEKAIDSVGWPFIKLALKKFNFGS